MNVIEENRRESISTQLFSSANEASLIVAQEIVELIKKNEQKGKKTILGLATGSTPIGCLLYTSPSPRDRSLSRMPSSA